MSNIQRTTKTRGAGECADEGASEQLPEKSNRVCTPKALPKRLLMRAAEIAVEINPVNAPQLGPLAEVAADLVMEPARLAVLTAKYWGPSPRRLTVSFMESTPAAVRSRIVSHMNAWTRTIGIQFVETQGQGQVRISRAQVGIGPTSAPTFS